MFVDFIVLFIFSCVCLNTYFKFVLNTLISCFTERKTCDHSLFCVSDMFNAIMCFVCVCVCFIFSSVMKASVHLIKYLRYI